MTNAILDLAKQRRSESDLPYAGSVTPREAFELLQNDANVHLIDVRTDAERDWVGGVQINAAQCHPIEWNRYPTQRNPNFLNDLNAIASNTAQNKDTVFLFLCRSGARSHAGAQLATENGYTQCYNILEGFEGDKDQQGHRKTVNGWCAANLPWVGA
jgi:rhodanese-related sulfurtransferase